LLTWTYNDGRSMFDRSRWSDKKCFEETLADITAANPNFTKKIRVKEYEDRGDDELVGYKASSFEELRNEHEKAKSLAMAPIGNMKSVEINDIHGTGPLILGTGPGLPTQLQGLFWLTKQGKSSALCSFGGPSKDGGNCSTGQLTTEAYKIRVSGDRVWSFAQNDFAAIKAAKKLDLVYHFHFDDVTNPTHCQIYPEARNAGVLLTAEWLLNFEMHLLEDGDPEYPNSVVWRRPSAVFGIEIKKKEYLLVQVMDGTGTRIEPAWSKFVEYENSEKMSGTSPGRIWYYEAP